MTDRLPPGPPTGRGSIQFFAETDPRLSGPRLAYQSPPPPDDEIRLEDLWRTVRRQWWVILATFVLVTGFTYLYTARKVPVWEASSLIRVESGDPTPTAALFGNMSGETWLETEMLVAGTRPVLSQVVEELDLQLRLTEPAGVPREFLLEGMEMDRGAPGASYEILAVAPNLYRLDALGPEGASTLAELRPGDTVHIPGGQFVLAPDSVLRARGLQHRPERIRFRTLEFDGAVGALQGGLDISRPDEWASIFRLTYRSNDRWMARNVVNAAAEAFIRRRREVQNTEARSTVAFLRDQAAQVQVELEAAENALQAFREGEQVVALASEANLQVQQLAGLQAERMGLAAERDGLQELLREIQSSGGSAPDYTRLIAFPTFLQNATFQNLVENLTDAERSRAELRARWTENHPGVLALDDQIALLKGRLRDIGQNYLQSLNTQIATLDATLVRFGSDLEEIPARELQYARLERQTQTLARIYEALQQSLKEWEVQEAVEDPSVRVVEHAVLPAGPVSPKPRRNLTLGAMVGLFLGLGLAFVRQLLDKKVRADDDVGQILGAPILSRVPRLPDVSAKTPRSKALVTLDRTRSLPAEAYKSLRTSILFSDLEGNGKRELVVTSPGARDGKSVTSCNLAISFAQQGYKTLLIDGDLRRSTLHLTFELENGPGLTEYLGGEFPLEELVRPTAIQNLFVIPAGRTPGNPSELLGHTRMDSLLERSREHFDAVVLDSPPVLAVTDATILANKVGGVVLVVRSDLTHKQAAEDALDQLRQVGARVLGVVVNDTDGGGRYGYRYSYYHQYYGQDPKKGGRKG